MRWPVQKDCGNDQDGDAGGEEPILDGRDRRFVFPERSELPHHQPILNDRL